MQLISYHDIIINKIVEDLKKLDRKNRYDYKLQINVDNIKDQVKFLNEIILDIEYRYNINIQFKIKGYVECNILYCDEIIEEQEQSE